MEKAKQAKVNNQLYSINKLCSQEPPGHLCCFKQPNRDDVNSEPRMDLKYRPIKNARPANNL